MSKYAWLALAVLVALGGVYAWGRHDGKEREQQAQASRIEAARVKTAKVEDKAATISTDVATKTEARQVEIRTVTRTIVQRIPVYVSPETDARYPLPRGLVSVYNDSLAGRLPALPDPAAISYGEPSDVAASRAGTLMASNNGACRADQQRLADLQSWLTRQAANQGATP